MRQRVGVQEAVSPVANVRLSHNIIDNEMLSVYVLYNAKARKVD